MLECLVYSIVDTSIIVVRAWCAQSPHEMTQEEHENDTRGRGSREFFPDTMKLQARQTTCISKIAALCRRCEDNIDKKGKYFMVKSTSVLFKLCTCMFHISKTQNYQLCCSVEIPFTIILFCLSPLLDTNYLPWKSVSFLVKAIFAPKIFLSGTKKTLKESSKFSVRRICLHRTKQDVDNSLLALGPRSGVKNGCGYRRCMQQTEIA